MDNRKPIPKIMVGRYAGTPVDKLPNGYLRWIITQDFPKNILEAAKEKLKKSDYNDVYMNVSRHATDMFSKRFLHLWLAEIRQGGNEADGIATFMVKRAQEAWERGADVSKHRHQNDGVMKELDGLIWVFGVNQNFPDYKDVITVMPSTTSDDGIIHSHTVDNGII